MKLKNFAFLLVFMVLMGLQSCTPSNDAKLEYLPVKVDKGDKWGMVDPSGKLLFSDEFDDIPSPVVNGVFFVEETSGYSLYIAESKPILIPGAENLIQAGFYTEGLIPVVREGERITLIDIKGSTKFTLNPVNGKEIIFCEYIFRDGNLNIGVQGEKCGTVDKKGNVVIDPIYDWLIGFSEGICVAGIRDEATKELEAIVGFNNQGKELFKIRGNYELPHFSTAYGYQGGRLVIKKGDVLGYLDKKGDFNKLPSKYTDYKPFSNKYYGIMNSDGRWGLVNENNDVLIRTKYDSIDYIGEDMFCVKTNDRYQLITSEGHLKVELDEREIASFYAINRLGFSNQFCLVGGKANSYMLFNRDGKPTSKGDFYELSLKKLTQSDRCLDSNYMDITAMAQYLANTINQTGFGGMKLGSTISDYLANRNPKDYVDQYRIPINLTDVKFLNAHITLYLKSNGTERVSLLEPVYSYDSYYDYPTFEGYQYSWNPNCKLECIELGIKGTGPLNKCATILVNLLKNKGFGEIEETEGDAWHLKDWNMDVYIYVNESNEMSIQII